jgi:spoIIIJ-associated protein
MSEAVEFVGKSVDDAIQAACDHFKCEREKLEVEILEGGSTGIFGLVGTKKAKVLARLRANKQELETVILGVVKQLLNFIVEGSTVSVDTTADPILVVIKDEKNSGLIIGKDGQTLASLQYIANRIVAKKWPEKVRVQLDTGDYREKQNGILRDQAMFLAEKAKHSGKPQSTKPLTSYHRRLIHLALKNEAGVITRSKGEGPLKRVVIIPKKGGHRAESEAEG